MSSYCLSREMLEERGIEYFTVAYKDTSNIEKVPQDIPDTYKAGFIKPKDSYVRRVSNWHEYNNWSCYLGQEINIEEGTKYPIYSTRSRKTYVFSWDKNNLIIVCHDDKPSNYTNSSLKQMSYTVNSLIWFLFDKLQGVSRD